MPRPNHGVLGLSFIACRGLQFVSLIIVLSLTARFINTIIDASTQPPAPLIGVLSVVCFAILYVVITLILYWDQALPLLPAAAADGMFFLALMITSIVIGKPLSYISCRAVGAQSVKTMVETVGQNLNTWSTTTPITSPTPTPVVEYATKTVSTAAATVAATVAPGATTQVQGSDGNLYTISAAAAARLFRRATTSNGNDGVVMPVVDYESWIRGGSENACVMMKAVWGFGIALTILFVFSAACVAFVCKRDREAAAPKRIGDDA